MSLMSESAEEEEWDFLNWLKTHRPSDYEILKNEIIAGSAEDCDRNSNANGSLMSSKKK